jgi:hypothetical protein
MILVGGGASASERSAVRRSGLFPAGGRDRLDVKFAAGLAFDLKLLVRSLDTQEHIIANGRVRHNPKRKLLVFKNQVHGTSLRPQAAIQRPKAKVSLIKPLSTPGFSSAVFLLEKCWTWYSRRTERLRER